MTELLASTPGLFPLPDWAKNRLGDLKGHQKEGLVRGEESGEVAGVYGEARAAVIERQREAGLDRIVEGQLRWDDMLAHPLCVHDAVETRGIVRYYDNNNFYREPVVVDKLGFDGDVAAELDAASELLADADAGGGDAQGHSDGDDADDGTASRGDGALQAVLPGPYSLAELATDEHYGDAAAFLDAVGGFLADEVGAFSDVETLFLSEPSLVVDPPGEGADERASAAIDRVAGATDADVVCQTYWGALDEGVHAHLLDAGVDAVGYDLLTEHEASMYNINEYGTKDDVALGVVDGQNTLVEEPETIAERVAWVRENSAAAFDTIYATPNTGLFYLPVGKFEATLDALGEAVALQGVRA
jgi:5-methyltetrahydropteroyltriglutamate--homocysteine methyltransferase